MACEHGKETGGVLCHGWGWGEGSWVGLERPSGAKGGSPPGFLISWPSRGARGHGEDEASELSAVRHPSAEPDPAPSGQLQQVLRGAGSSEVTLDLGERYGPNGPSPKLIWESSKAQGDGTGRWGLWEVMRQSPVELVPL